jgi:hypothetical protein
VKPASWLPLLAKTVAPTILCHRIMISPQAQLRGRPWLGTHKDLFEQLIRVAATIAYQGYQDGYSVGLISNGCLARADRPFQISPSRSSQQLASLLQALAAVTPYTSAPFENFLVKSMPKVPYGATLVVVTALMPPVLIETLLSLKRYRPNTTLISLDTCMPPQIPGVRTVHLPFEPGTDTRPA